MLPLLHAVVDAYGAGRVLWESDLGGPVQMQNPQEDFGACVALVSDVADFLTAEQREQILGGTAQRLLWGRPPPP